MFQSSPWACSGMPYRGSGGEWGGGEGASKISVQYFSQRLKRKETETFKKNIVEFNWKGIEKGKY